jgi:hypothetical protein
MSSKRHETFCDETRPGGIEMTARTAKEHAQEKVVAEVTARERAALKKHLAREGSKVVCKVQGLEEWRRHGN